MIRKFNTDLFLASLEVIPNWLINSWRSEFPDAPALTAQIVRSSDDLRGFKSQLEGSDSDTSVSGQEINFPLVMLIITSIAPNEAKNPFVNKHIGQVTGRKADSSKVEVSNILPVKVGIGLRLRTTNFLHVVYMLHILTFAMPKITIDLQSDTGLVMQCSMSLDSDLSIPQADLGSYAKEFVFETTFVLNSFLIKSVEMGVIRTIKFEVKDLNGSVADQNEITLASINKHYLDLFDKSRSDYIPED